MAGMFMACNSIELLPNISKWDTSNVTNIEGMFALCNSLKSYPDLSNWNTSNIINMRNLFYRYNQKESKDLFMMQSIELNNISLKVNMSNPLISLPDIARWDTSKVSDMAGMFGGCDSLISLPDISN